ncbi:uncharacterized [Tachysurus ichikawai]
MSNGRYSNFLRTKKTTEGFVTVEMGTVISLSAMRFTLISAKSATSLKWDFRACSCSASVQHQRRFVLTAPSTQQPNHSKLQSFTAFNFTGG